VRLRAARLSLGWSLADFEIHSAGSITAVAMGSYERGTRALSITKLLTICDIFQISLIHILAPVQELTSVDSSRRRATDIRNLGLIFAASQEIEIHSYQAWLEEQGISLMKN